MSHTFNFTERKRLRRRFGQIKETGAIPNLLEMQQSSYESFLRPNENADGDRGFSLEDAFKSVFPIKDFLGRAELQFVRYRLDDPKYDVEECQRRGSTYSAPLKVTLSLVVKEIDPQTKVSRIETIKEQDVFMGDMPLMTGRGTFIVNGSERVIVSQMHRSPGVFFDQDNAQTASSSKVIFSARVIPYRGSWLDFEFDARDILHVRVDRKRKVPATTLLMALDGESTAKLRREYEEKDEKINETLVDGMSREEILAVYYDSTEAVESKNGQWHCGLSPKAPFFTGKVEFPIANAETGEILLESGKQLTARIHDRWLKDKLSKISLPDSALIGRFLAKDLVDSKGLVLAHAGDEISEEMLAEMRSNSLNKLQMLDIDGQIKGPFWRNTLAVDRNSSRDEALIDFYRVIRPGEPPTRESAENTFRELFFDSERFDLSTVGRIKINERLGITDADETLRVLRKEELIEVIKVLLNLKDGRGEVDDIDNLGNRRVRSVGELLENQYRIGLARMERQIRERMSTQDLSKAMPQELINAKPSAAAVKEFFGSSQLSQFMDQTNPLSEVTHKRRLSALGPGGLTRDHAGFEVRDVHPTHYGRICPVETPEGPNIGLINSLATYARINPYGFIETPFHSVKNGVVQDDVVYLTASREAGLKIAQANTKIDTKSKKITEALVTCRKSGDLVQIKPEEVELIDISPKQVFSVAASLIPFLENDDANRALMGSNMQRQAVPLLRAEAPMVGTGMEARVACDSGVTIVALRDGVVDQLDATRIVIKVDEEADQDKSRVDIYNLLKFQRSNQNTCINQRPLVRVGNRVKAGDIIADGPSTDLGELALGRNILIAFMPWNGYNFEDSILVSERIARDDVFTSIHIEEKECVARDTKLGQEEITRDIPNVGEDSLRHLDETGIAYIGAEVGPGDILVGRVTPKGESPITPEEKLLRAIFGDKAADVRDSSLRVPPGVTGTVVEVRVFTRRGVDKDERAQSIHRSDIERLAQDRDSENKILERTYAERVVNTAKDQTSVDGPKGVTFSAPIKIEELEKLSARQLTHLAVKNEKINNELAALRESFETQLEAVKLRFEDKVEKLMRGDELPPGVMKMVKIFIAVKRKLQPGDKMAGRHGNKGVVSRIMPMEDMPFLEDGTPIDIVLNPLGLPSRMNVGQILETHLGWACTTMGKNLSDMVEEAAANQKNIASLKSAIKALYPDEDFAKEIEEMNDGEVMELAGNLSKGLPVATPIFDGASETDINQMLEKANLPTSGQVRLIDGRTGEYFNRPITVGYLYMLKLHHLVDEKLHARSTGPYSLVTQQPLGGKAQFGGQRFGEMEVWALEAYGAAYTLQEILTVKSDDISGRTKVYESIIRGDDSFEVGVPESFNVLIKELRSLGLNVELRQAPDQIKDPSLEASTLES